MGAVLSRMLGKQAAAHASRVAGLVGRALRQGVVVGTKVRLPHSAVSATLFKLDRGVTANLVAITRDTWVHSRNLAYFATSYKLILYLSRLAWERGGLPTTLPAGSEPPRDLRASALALLSARPTHPAQVALAAGVASALVWASPSVISYQILLYVLSRVVISAGRLASEVRGTPFEGMPFARVYPALAVGVWVAVMLLFEYRPDALQSSMRRSMEALYHFDGPELAAGDLMPSPMWCGVAAFVVAWAYKSGGARAVLDAFRVLPRPVRP